MFLLLMSLFMGCWTEEIKCPGWWLYITMLYVGLKLLRFLLFVHKQQESSFSCVQKKLESAGGAINQCFVIILTLNSTASLLLRCGKTNSWGNGRSEILEWIILKLLCSFCYRNFYFYRYYTVNAKSAINQWKKIGSAYHFFHWCVDTNQRADTNQYAYTKLHPYTHVHSTNYILCWKIPSTFFSSWACCPWVFFCMGWGMGWGVSWGMVGYGVGW